jgi:hypothetical protein
MIQAVPADNNLVDLKVPIEMLENLLAECRALHGKPLMDGGKNNPYNRDVNTQLLFLSDTLLFVGGMVRSEYWLGRGKEL